MPVNDEEEKFKKIKATSPYYRIDSSTYMIFHESSMQNFNSCNCYLIKDGDEIVLIDPGCSRENLARTLEAENLELGNIKSILLTHAHSDHYGLVGYLKQNTGCEVYVHEQDREFLEDTTKYIDFLFERSLLKTRPKFKDLYRILENFVNRATGNAFIVDTKINPIIEMIFNTWDIQSIVPDHEFHDDDQLPGNLVAMHLPGHTPGHSGFMHQSKPFIFCGDIDFNKRGPVVSSTNANIFDFKRSIRKMKDIVRSQRILKLFPGHWHPVFTEIQGKLDAFGKEFDKKEARILEILFGHECMKLDDVTNETFKDFINYFQDFISDDTKDSLLVGEASELQTNRNYLAELERQNKITRKHMRQEDCWKSE
jgi:glyoxylase-like metal-dependent hydrolase (beta-lactamase superfamily II)